MRRAIQQGRALGLQAPWLGRFAERTIELMGETYPELEAERETIARWVGDEEESFGRTLDRGTELLERLASEAEEAGTSWIDAADAFKLHDTYGFPYDLTKELLAERGLAVEDAGFEELMEEQRQRARTGAATAHGSENTHEKVTAFAAARRRPGSSATRRCARGPASPPSRPTTAAPWSSSRRAPSTPRAGARFADSGVLRWAGAEAKVLDVYRVGEDQAIEVEPSGEAIEAGVSVEAEVDRETRHATMRNHTATHLLHAALREQLGSTCTRPAPPSAGQAAFRLQPTATHSAQRSWGRSRTGSTSGSSRAGPCAGCEMERAEAEKLGAMALFGEKYGEWVRVVEVDGVSRELCGGTHVANTAEIGIFKLVGEGSSAANVRRVEAITGPAAIDWFREREAQLREAGEALGSAQDPVGGARPRRRAAARGRRRRRTGAARAARRGGKAPGGLRPGGGRPEGRRRCDRASRPEAAARRRQPGAVDARRRLGAGARRRARARRSRSSPWPGRRRSTRASRRLSWCARPRAWSAAAAGVARTWPRPAAAILPSSATPWRRRGQRSSGSWAERCASSPWTTAPFASAARSRTRPGPWRRRCP